MLSRIHQCVPAPVKDITHMAFFIYLATQSQRAC